MVKLACDECGASGRVRTETGRLDICSKCFGLGFVEEEREEELPDKKKLVSRFYYSMSVFVVILIAYYFGLYVALLTYGFSFLMTMVLFVGGHVAIFGGFMFFVAMRLLKSDKQDDQVD